MAQLYFYAIALLCNGSCNIKKAFNCMRVSIQLTQRLFTSKTNGTAPAYCSTPVTTRSLSQHGTGREIGRESGGSQRSSDGKLRPLTFDPNGRVSVVSLTFLRITAPPKRLAYRVEERLTTRGHRDTRNASARNRSESAHVLRNSNVSSRSVCNRTGRRARTVRSSR